MVVYIKTEMTKTPEGSNFDRWYEDLLKDLGQTTGQWQFNELCDRWLRFRVEGEITEEQLDLAIARISQVRQIKLGN